MFTMSTRQIKSALKRRRERRMRPWSLSQLAKLRGCSRSVMTMALQQPARYRDARLFIEEHLRESV